MSYTELTVIQRGIILIFTELILFLYFYFFLKMLTLVRKVTDILIPGLMFGITFLIFQFLVMIQEKDISPDFEIPLFSLIAVLAALMLYSFYMGVRIRRWQKNHISAMSVKEAIDRLPTGILIYTKKGSTLMMNETAIGLCRDLFGTVVVDVTQVYERLKERSDASLAGKDSGLTIRDSRGRIFEIRKKNIEIEGTELTELTTVDISRECELTEELKKRQDRARVLNARLKNLMATIEYVTMNRELLKLKTELHNNIGQCILTAKRCVVTPGSVDKEHMIRFWKQNIRHLIDDSPEEWEQPYYVISKEADRLGIKLDLIGELPTEQKLIPIVDAAVSVHIGNTLKHADGTEATIAVRTTGESYVISFTNNGKQPEEEIREGGGLTNLRNEVENAGGSMEIRSVPAYELKIILPRDQEGDRG